MRNIILFIYYYVNSIPFLIINVLVIYKLLIFNSNENCNTN
jgi:hypothetical protein